jgi:UTP:GlnB (protein PII) uridylyltransferase
MPAAYHAQFNETDARDHAAIVWRRNHSIAHIEQWIAPQCDAIWLCVVTDDRPGLLASLSAAITAHSLNILDAKIFCHMDAKQRSEAVDFFRVVPVTANAPNTLNTTELAALSSTIAGVLRGKIDLRTLRERALPTWRPVTRPQTSVYFGESIDGENRLIVETDDQPGLLASITAALFKLSISIEWSNVATIAGRVYDEFHLVAQDGLPFNPLRKDSVVAHIAAALDLLEPSSDDGSPRASEDEDDQDGCRPSRMMEPMPAPGLQRFSKPPGSF